MKNMNNYRVAFIDIDWTILNHRDGHYFDLESINAIKKAQSLGLLIFFCTARTYASVVYTRLIDLIKPDGIICTNGAVILIGDQPIFIKPFPHDIVQKCFEVANNHDFVLELTTIKDKYFTNSPNQYVKNYLSIYYETIPAVLKQPPENVTQILLFAPSEYDDVLINELPKSIEYHRYDTNGVSLNYHHNLKGEAVKYTLNHIKIDKKYAIAFGDSEDDISMFNEVGTSVAMGNSKTELVKEKATIVADTIDNHGVATIIANLFFK